MSEPVQEDYEHLIHLPYGSFIDDEASRHFHNIKTSLGLCLAYREVGKPLKFWLNQLYDYIILYKLKLSKEDHILLAKLLYELLTVPNLPFHLISAVYSPLKNLLKKRVLLPRKDLSLPWKPLYDLYWRVDPLKSYDSLQVINAPFNLHSEVMNCVECAQYYFDSSATQEILAELRPLLCPFDLLALRRAAIFCFFLPVTDSPELADSTYKLWLPEMMRFWEVCDHSGWGQVMIIKLANLAKLNSGYIDWEEYLPAIYVRLQKTFELPVYYKSVKYPRRSKIIVEEAVQWIVYTLGGGSRGQEYLDRLLGTLESYCQSANEGPWTHTIKSFLTHLASSFRRRIRNERLFCERRRVPEGKQLTDEDVRRLVVSVQPIAMSAIFTESFSANFSAIWRDLAELRPDIIVPPLLDKLYSTIEGLTKPHQFTAMLQCVRHVARPMLSGGLNHSYLEGKKHVIPLLFAVLPGLTSVNFEKCSATLEFLSTFLSMIPIVDCSSFFDLTPMEEEVASTTSQFEEFVLLFMKRVFVFVESFAEENVDTNDQKKVADSVNLILKNMHTCCSAIIGGTSQEIFKVALKRLNNYTTGKIFESSIAAPAIACILKAFAETDAEETYRIFIPALCTPILEANKNQAIKNEENVNQELMCKMFFLCEIVRGESPSALKPYLPILLDVVDETLHAKCKECHERSSYLLENILTALGNILPLNYRERLSGKTMQTCPIRDWGQSITCAELNIQWYVPGEEEISIVERTFWKYLMPELERIDKYNEEEVDLSRDDIRWALYIIVKLLMSCILLLKPWTEESLLLDHGSLVPCTPMTLELGVTRYIRMPDGANVFEVLINKLTLFHSKLQQKSNDPLALIYLTQAFLFLLNDGSKPLMHMDKRNDHIKIGEEMFKKSALSTSSNLRSVLTEQVYMKHMNRMLMNRKMRTLLHKSAIISLFNLATSDYKVVRSEALPILRHAVPNYVNGSFLVDLIVDNLKADAIEYKERLKGTLELLIDSGSWFTPVSSSFEQLKFILPAVVSSMPTEDISIIIEQLEDSEKDAPLNFWQFAVNIKIPDNIVDAAKNLWTTSEMSRPLPSDEEIRAGEARLDINNQKAQHDFEELIALLMKAVESKRLLQRYELMAAKFIAQCFLPNEEKNPPEVARYFLNLLLHGSPVLREYAIRVVPKILKRYKAKSVKEIVDPFSLSGDESTTVARASSELMTPGPRPDNEWCRFSETFVPKTEVEWNQVRYSYCCYIGFYGWPKELRLCSSPASQPVNNVNFDTLSGVGKEIDLFFLNESKIAKFFEYLSLVEINEESIFEYYTDQLFKYLFKIHCDRYLEIFKPHIEAMLACKEDSYQVCAGKILLGIVSGAKLWPFDKAQKLVEWYVPLLKRILDEGSAETCITLFKTITQVGLRLDVNRSWHLFHVLMDDPIRGDDLTIRNCRRLFFLQAASGQLWRLSEIWRRLLDNIKPHLAHRYQDLRVHLAVVLGFIFETDIEMDGWNRTLAPQVSDFITYLLPKLDILYSISAENAGVSENVDGLMNDKVLEAIRLWKTVSLWCHNFLSNSEYPLKQDFFKIFPLLCLMENYGEDNELKTYCRKALSSLCHATMLMENVPAFLDAFDKVCNGNSWSAKCTSLNFLQAFIVHKLFLVTHEEEWILRITDSVLRLLVDDRCEVRQEAGEVMSGIFHYRIIKDPSKLIEKFKVLSTVLIDEKKSNLNIRHAGVIGLCSFINAYPYTVPPEVPPLFADLSHYLTDPEPISSIIRKTLGSFKRTHFADWEQSKSMFTNEQLEVLADLVAPPDHYS